jgi:hypothetical protein
MAARLHQAAANLRSRVSLWPRVVEGYATGGTNRMSALFDPGSLGGVHGRLMSHAAFDLAPEQALVVRVWPGTGDYTGIQLGDAWFSSLEYANRQTSMSTDQAVPSSDGSFWFVVSHVDPGTSNWLDTTGHRRGFVLVRYDGIADGSPPPPSPTAHVVALGQLRATLPADTPASTEADRRADLARRRRHVQRRYGI